MFAKTTLSDWENLVQKQLKTDDIHSVLQKENLEGITVKPYHGSVARPLSLLPKVEESTQLVSRYAESLEEDVIAFLLDKNVENLEEKNIYINNKDLAEHISPEETNSYYSLIDIFSESTGEMDRQLGTELLAKAFNRNLCVDISLHQNAGAAIYQQLGIALAKAKDLVEVYGAEVLDKLVFRFAVSANYFFEIAKIRAFKLVYAQFAKEYGLRSIPYIFVETSLRNKSKNDPENNLIRSTVELSAAMIGGADAVFSNDYLLESGNSLSTEVSFKQQIVLAYESIINVFEDGANGSYYVEDITRQLASKAWAFFVEMEQTGGYAEMMKKGELQKLIYTQALEAQKWLEEGRLKMIGVNMYPKLEKTREAGELYSPTEIRAVRLAQMFE